jgi:hypothetical protein
LVRRRINEQLAQEVVGFQAAAISVMSSKGGQHLNKYLKGLRDGD